MGAAVHVTRSGIRFYCIPQPKIQANVAGAADAVMLDVEGFVSETNSANIFLVKEGVLTTPLAGSCLPGITRWEFCFCF